MNPAGSGPRAPRIGAAVAAGILACGIPLWPIPYHQVNMLANPSATVWLLGGAVAGVIARILLRPSMAVPTLSVGAGFVLAVMGRVLIETSVDPTSHNLWPFEVVIAGGVGLAGGLVGVLLARLAQGLKLLR
ncbi:MAG: hypothetical protein ACRENN_07135 [Candidatus Eiseniibacteriota bacterium]